jgi:hypothetical protein
MLEGITFLYAAWLFYGPAWQSDSMAFAFWAPAGLIVHLSLVEERRQKQASVDQSVAEGTLEPMRVLPMA